MNNSNHHGDGPSKSHRFTASDGTQWDAVARTSGGGASRRDAGYNISTTFAGIDFSRADGGAHRGCDGRYDWAIRLCSGGADDELRTALEGSYKL